MSSPRIDPPIGGTPAQMVAYSIQVGQQERNTAVRRDKDLTIDKGRLFQLKGPLAMTSITPPDLSEDVVNYLIPGEGIDRTGMVRLAATVAIDIHGIVARKNEFLWLINVGSANITLMYRSAICKLVNRMIMPSPSNLILTSNDSAELYYDTISEIWRVLRP